ncbi:MAG: glycosyltransferase [Clostridia bacterium]|nr:glycosyltransferase [Clostridia bacterium]
MKVVQINVSYGRGSTGRICLGIAELLEKNGFDNRTLYSVIGVDSPLAIKYTHPRYIKFQALRSRVLGTYGFNSVRATRTLLSELEKLAPDIVHLHNIHSHDCNFEMLLSYLKDKHIKTIWTFHDCWCFTGYCTYFDVVKCERWMIGCQNCPQKNLYSWFFDKSDKLYQRKKEAVDGLDLTIVTPSAWMAGLVKRSFFSEYPFRVIHNGIDLSVFKPTENGSPIAERKNGEKIVLGVALGWENRKGLDVFISLSNRLPSNYRIVLVGTDDYIDKFLPGHIISIHRTHNQNELAALYSAADVFVNPTREENYPTVNMEALACGTPVVTFRTGGSPETLGEDCGSVVERDDIDSLEKEIIRICETHPYSKEDCVNHAKAFDQNERFMEYVELYKELL